MRSTHYIFIRSQCDNCLLPLNDAGGGKMTHRLGDQLEFLRGDNPLGGEVKQNRTEGVVGYQKNFLPFMNESSNFLRLRIVEPTQ